MRSRRAAVLIPHAHPGVRGLLCVLLSALLIGGIGTQAATAVLSATATTPATEYGALGPADDTPASRHVGIGWRQYALTGSTGVAPTGGHGVIVVLPTPPRAARPAVSRAVAPSAGYRHPRTGLLTAPGRAPPSTGT